MSIRPRLVVAVYGLINAGKSSLINALAGSAERPTGPIGGTTQEVSEVGWQTIDADLGTFDVRLLDTPGLEEVGDSEHSSLAAEAARSADLVLFVAAEDLTATALHALTALRAVGKPIVLALNKVDLLAPEEEASILASVRERLSRIVAGEDIVPIAAAPIVRERVGARVEARRGEPRVDPLIARLVAAVAESGEDLKALNEARLRIEAHARERERLRAERRPRAERVADETAVGLALALAVNPIPLIDFLTGPAGLVVLVARVSAVYGEAPSTEAARALASELFKGGRVVLWGSMAAVFAGGAMKFVPGVGHLAGALTQGAAAGYLTHVLGRALVEYLDNGHDWGDGGLIAALDRIAASTDRKALTKGLVAQLKARLKAGTRGGATREGG
jgi:GTPase